MEYINPDSSRNFKQWLVGFVDDNYLLLKLNKMGYDAPAEKHIEEAKRSLEIWQRLVLVSGGELELIKISHYLMTWKLADGSKVGKY